ncbi:MAG TPA: hypothetical protein VFE46_15835 [Pirellulales bacterium]|jgi:hypothetical protein|nr:hypothetical protein [Pirellulales bacterium]
MTYFLVYWKPDTVLADEVSPRLFHSASNQYHRVAVGDVLWIVTSEEPDDLLLVGRQRVDRVVGQQEAEQLTKSSTLWKAEYHVFCNTPEEKGNLNISGWARQLRFDGAVTQLPEGFSGQHLQTMRRIEDVSGELLERLWSQREDVQGAP